MFNIFKKKQTPEGLVDKLAANYHNCAKIMNNFYEFIPNLHEPGIFVVGIACHPLRSLSSRLSHGFINLFSASYLSFVSSSFEIEDGSVSYNTILQDFDNHGVHYYNILSNLFTVIKQRDSDKTYEYMRLLFKCYFENCTGEDSLVLVNYEESMLFDYSKALFDEAMAICNTTLVYLH